MAVRPLPVPTTRLVATKASTTKADALIVGVTREGLREIRIEIPASTGLSTAERRRITESLTHLGATGKADEVHRLPAVTGFASPLIVCVGLGTSGADITAEALRRATGAGTMALGSIEKVAVAMPATTPTNTAAVAQGATLGSYRFEAFRGTGTSEPARVVKSIAICSSESRDRHVREAVRQAEIVAGQVWFARNLVNTPPSALHPIELADAALDAAVGKEIEVEILDEKALAAGKFGGILAVGQGSANPPRLIRMAYRPARSKVHVALVGKGITFDSGGLSLKPPTAMETMKCDMGGAAAVIAAIAAIAELGLPASVTAYAACAENMPSGTAQRPGDVLTTYGGRTVEVLNTDAEGRLVLADALVRASEDTPDFIIDVATLTGAQMVALGTRVAAVMANDDDLRDDVVRAADLCGEQFWPMPLPKELRPSIDSPIADLANIGDRMGGMLTAGLFLQEFVPDDVAWAHLDIAGPAFNDGKPHDYTPKGGTGASVRTLVQLVRDLADAR